MNCWYFQNRCIEPEDIPEGSIGYIYRITSLIDLPDYPKGSLYIGRKMLNFSRRAKISKREQEATNNLRKKFKVVVKESDWLEYFSSSKTLSALVDAYGKENFKREILLFCNTKSDMTYWETYFQIVEEVLFTNSFNMSILGKFYKGKVNKYD